MNLLANLCVSALVLALVLVATSDAQDVSINASQNTTGQFAKDVLSTLAKSHLTDHNTFVEQEELGALIAEGGGGPCASAAGIAVLQALRQMAGLEKVANPHKAVLESFHDQKSLLGGRVTNNQFVRVIKFYEKHLGERQVSVEVTSAPNSPHASGGKVWAEGNWPDLTLAANQIRVLSYTVTDDKAEVLGRHFVLLKEVDGKQIEVFDPAVPTKKRAYALEHRANTCGRIFLNQPEGTPPRTSVYELNTIFTIDLNATTQPANNHPLSLEQIKVRIDETAERLKSQGKLRSPRIWRSETATFGLPALDLPKDLGGSEWPAIEMLEVFKHAGRYDLNLRDVVGGAHARLLVKSSSPEVRSIARQVAEGRAYVAIAITEPNFGSDFSSMESNSKKVEGGYLLNGKKRFNARLDQASHVIVITKSPENKRGRLNVFVLPIDAKGLEVERFGAHGLTGNSYGGLTLTDVFVPDSHLIGRDGEGRDVFNEHFRYWRLMQTAAALGTAEKALDMMAERLKTRHVFGGPIGRFTHLQQPMGQHTTELRMAHSLAKEAADLIDKGDGKAADPFINGLKAEGLEIALKAVDSAARAYGGEGYSDLVDIGDRLRDLNGLRIADGTTDVMRSAVVADKFGREFWEMATKGSADSESNEGEK